MKQIFHFSKFEENTILQADEIITAALDPVVYTDGSYVDEEKVGGASVVMSYNGK